MAKPKGNPVRRKTLEHGSQARARQKKKKKERKKSKNPPPPTQSSITGHGEKRCLIKIYSFSGDPPVHNANGMHEHGRHNSVLSI